MNEVDFLDWLDREGIFKIARWPARVSIELLDGSFGVDRTVSAALAKAKAGDENIRKVA